MFKLSELPGHLSLRALGPVAAVPVKEALRAGLGALIGLLLASILASLLAPDQWAGLYLIAPFGATSVLLFAAPNSPLAQPWPAIVGNTVSALVTVGVCQLVHDPLLSIPLSVGLAIVTMALLRATHPPGGAVAITVAVGAERILADGLISGLYYALLPVALGTLVLVTVAVIYAHVTGRRYPLRQFAESNRNLTKDPVAVERIGLSEQELTDILSNYRQSLNLGVEDLARLISAAELQAASHRAGPETADHIMSRDLVTVLPDTPIHDVAALFVRHGFTSLPVVARDGEFRGVIFQLHMIKANLDQGGADQGGALSRIRRLGRPARPRIRQAADIMQVDLSTANADTPIAALLPQLAANGLDAVPIVDGPRIVGVVTQTDLIAALARQSLRPAAVDPA